MQRFDQPTTPTQPNHAPGRSARPWLAAIGVPLLLAIALSALGCHRGDNPTLIALASPTLSQVRQASNIVHTDLPTDELPTGSYAYLPAQDQLALHSFSETARIEWAGRPLRIALIAATPAEIEGASVGWRGISTTLRITNDGDGILALEMSELLDAMSSSRHASEGGKGMHMASPLEVTLAAGESADIDVLWFVEAAEPDAMLWLTAALPLSEGGYARLDAGGAIFGLSMASIDYPRGTPTPCALSATLVSESLADGALLPPGQAFEQTWVIRNSGTCRWPGRSSWTHVGGDILGALAAIELEAVPQPDELLTVTVSMTAPMALGSYRSDWRLQAPTGEPYGRSFYVEIIVTDTVTAGPTS